MRDLVFVLLVLGFFAIAVLFVRACELMLGARPALENERQL